MQHAFYLAPAFGKAWLRTFVEEDYLGEIQENEHLTFPDSKRVFRSGLFSVLFSFLGSGWSIKGLINKIQVGRLIRWPDK